MNCNYGGMPLPSSSEVEVHDSHTQFSHLGDTNFHQKSRFCCINENNTNSEGEFSELSSRWLYLY